MRNKTEKVDPVNHRQLPAKSNNDKELSNMTNVIGLQFAK